MRGSVTAWSPLQVRRTLRRLADVVLLRHRVGTGAYLAVATTCDIIPKLVLGALVAAMGTAFGGALPWGALPGSAGELAVDFLGVVVLAPLVETCLLMVTVGLVEGVTSRTVWVVLVPALLWGVAHGIFTDGWVDLAGRVVAVTWGFTVYTVVYLAWRQEGRWRGFAMAAAVHAANNLVVMLALAAAWLMGGR